MAQLRLQIRAKGKLSPEAIAAIRAGLQISQADFVSAVEKVKPSVSGADLQKFAKWMEEYGAT